MWETVLAQGVEADTPEEREEIIKKHDKILKAVQEILQNNEIINSVLSNYNLDSENLTEYEYNRKERISCSFWKRLE